MINLELTARKHLEMFKLPEVTSYGLYTKPQQLRTLHSTYSYDYHRSKYLDASNIFSSTEQVKDKKCQIPQTFKSATNERFTVGRGNTKFMSMEDRTFNYQVKIIQTLNSHFTPHCLQRPSFIPHTTWQCHVVRARHRGQTKVLVILLEGS